MLKNIRIVLVRTFHSGNIGSAARAMKTMGLTDLCLVSPKDFETSEGKKEALKMAMSADDVVEKAQVVESLYEAVKDCTAVIASTARTRGYDLPELNPEECAKRLYSESENNKVALVFGPERMGLSNEDLQLAKNRVTIPTNPDYSSLNIAAAVQTLSYEVFKQNSGQEDIGETRNLSTLPSAESLEQLYVHMEETLKDTGFIIKNHPGEVMQKLRNVFTRAELDETEVSILRGVLSSVDRSTSTNNKTDKSSDN